MIAMKMIKTLISCLRPRFLKAKILVNTDMYLAAKITTLSINV